MAIKVENKSEDIVSKKTCGIIMPISDCLDYRSGHWRDVFDILRSAIDETDFQPNLVSDEDAVGLIQDRIVTNIYNNEIVICDVSSKNPNVMFELGMRLAFDKPTIIIKDDKTGYSFDIGNIEHIPYPSSLRFADIVDFKNKLIDRIKATYEKSQTSENYSPFLKSFGRTIKPSSIQPTEIPGIEYILNVVSDIKRELRALNYTKNNESVIEEKPKTYKPLRFKFSPVSGGKEYFSENSHEEVEDLTDLINPA